MEGKNLPNDEVSAIDLKQLIYEHSSECRTPEGQSDEEIDEDNTDMQPIIGNNMNNPQNVRDELIYLPEELKKSTQILQHLNSKVKSFSFTSPSAIGEEELIDEHFWSRKMKKEPNDKNLKLKQINEESCEDRSVEYISPTYAQICEFKDAMKDAVMQLKLIE